MKPEQLLSTRVANHMQMHHKDIIYRFDIGADVPLPPALAKRSKQLHGRWSKGYPDLFIAKAKKKYGGLYLELKAVNIFKEDGVTLKASAHNEHQNYIHMLLRKAGYKCMFCIGFEDCIKKIKKYLK